MCSSIIWYHTRQFPHDEKITQVVVFHFLHTEIENIRLSYLTFTNNQHLRSSHEATPIEYDSENQFW